MHRIHKALIRELRSRKWANFWAKPAGISYAYIRKRKERTTIESHSSICFAARERNRTKFNCLRTYWGSRRRRCGGKKVDGRRKDPLTSRYSNRRSGKDHREFSRIISKRLSTYLHFPSPLHFPRLSLTLISTLYVCIQHRRRVVLSFVCLAGYRIFERYHKLGK